MSKTKTTDNSSLITLIDSNDLLEMENLDKFNAIINVTPPDDWLERHPVAKGVRFLPIGRTEVLLTKIFQEWHVETLREGQLANSIYCAIRLHYIHPITKRELFQDGLGAVPLKTDSGHTAADLAHIKSDAVQTGLPAAESEAIKDAAHKIGKIFGGDVNRKHTADFVGSYTASDDDKVEQRIKKAKSAEEIDEIMSSLTVEDQELFALTALERSKEIRNGRS